MLDEISHNQKVDPVLSPRYMESEKSWPHNTADAGHQGLGI